ncbi:MAG: CvpA family protein [Limisphaerales bacterium]
MQYLKSDFFSALNMNWFDLAVVVWLIIGVFRGRKHGMSQELLPLTQWIAFIVVASLFYIQIAHPLAQRTGLTLLPCAIAAYIFLGCFVFGLLGNLKKKLDDKFQEGDYFGSGEYYLGMTSGVIRFICILIAFLAVMNSRIITKTEREATLKMQEKNFEGVRFPTYGEVQNAVLFESATGNFVRAYLPNFLIAPVNAYDVPKPKLLHISPKAVAKSSSSNDGGLKITFAK